MLKTFRYAAITTLKKANYQLKEDNYLCSISDGSLMIGSFAVNHDGIYDQINCYDERYYERLKKLFKEDLNVRVYMDLHR